MRNFAKKYGPWALVTGASSGIGKEMATQLAAEGLNVVIVARRQNLLDEVKNELIDKHSVQVRTIQADLTKHDAIEQIEAATRDLDIGLVIPNAGTEIVGEFVESDIRKNSELVHLNTVAPMQIANVFGRHLKKRGEGGILFVSSLFGYQGIPYVANYAATKAYILSLGEALHVEMSRYGVDVSVLSPGLTATEMKENMGIDFKKIPMFSMKPERTARVGLRALGKKVTVVPGLLNKIYAWENRFIPRTWPVSLFGFLIHRAQKNEIQLVHHQEASAR
ncbi:MAG: SDR family oxidoreductase [Pseudomonadota bacterium]